MAKKHKRFHSRVQREVLNKTPKLFTSPRLLGRTIVRTQSQLLLDNARLFGQDQRTYNPIKTSIRPERTTSGLIASTTIQKNKPLRTARFQYVLPEKTTVCVRRGVRKEVLHALNKTGRASGRSKKRLTSNSRIKC